MLVSLKDILIHARQHHYAVPAFDCNEDVMVRAILETAEAHRAPVILMALAQELDLSSTIYLAHVVRGVAGSFRIPVALHLDHATDLQRIEAAVDAGFTSVMIDGSTLSFEDNVRLTQQTVALAKPHGISVEAELGRVGGSDLSATVVADNVLTAPDEVARFVGATGIDALAVSIGTSHGMYHALPNLNIDRLQELNAVSTVPLVLHGGSGTPPDQIRQAVCHGVCKLNIYADCRIAMGRGLQQAATAISRPDPLPAEMFGPIKDALAEVVADKIGLSSAGGQAWN